ncbi:MAG: DEAD/DEAH box helicase [Bacteroidota bacterium]
MKVAPEQPFELIYSMFQHEYLGYIFESFVVQLDAKNQLTFSNQNISSKNAAEFHEGLDDNDYELIRLMDSMQQDKVIQHFVKKKIKADQFFLKVYNKKAGDKLLQEEINGYLERRRSQIMPLLQGKRLFEMGSDGEPTWREVEILEDRASVLFHFRKNEDNTHYFPTIKLRDEKVDFLNNGSYIVSLDPAWMVVNGQLFTFEQPISGGKLKPFLHKKFILIPKNVEETYFEKFVAPLVASFDVYAKGFEIKTKSFDPKPILKLSEVQDGKGATLFDSKQAAHEEDTKMLVELSLAYGDHRFRADHLKEVSVSLEKQNEAYTFHRIKRKIDKEKEILQTLNDRGLSIKNARTTVTRGEMFAWLNANREVLDNFRFDIHQQKNNGKVYFLGESSIDIKIEEGIDWFDVKAIVRFGPYEIPFKEIRKLILQKKNEVKLPNGEIGIIPDNWASEYGDLFAFSKENDETNGLALDKHHLALVNELKTNNSAKVAITEKLNRLLDFDEIEHKPVSKNFKGSLRPYQLAGYNWMQFLDEYAFGGCLADDMGLGKTVQTLTLLQEASDRNEGATHLLIMPTSLIYNWEMEAKRFTPKLKVLNYTGSNRSKDHRNFARYNLVITSYGITRLDVEILKEFYFDYIVLDESQAIKNPESIISKTVRELKSRRKLILTGTPIENSTMDLWSQLSFANPGLLGSKSYFKNEYLVPIEKKNDEDKIKRLNALIKPFILRREKSQVATDLPEKVINVKYCSLSEQQREVYEQEKNFYRNKILDAIEADGLKNSQFLLLEGLTKLRQIANHPSLVDQTYGGDSGKFEDITYMVENALRKDHKILIFSQFVKHLKLVSRYLEDRQIPFAYLDGGVKDRRGQVEKFQESEDTNIFLISLKAGGLGLNLTKADYVFILDPWWNPAIEAQAIDRAHRIGQRNKVFTYKFISRETVEEKILLLQQSKLKLAQDLITIEESFVKSLTKEDITKLFN